MSFDLDSFTAERERRVAAGLSPYEGRSIAKYAAGQEVQAAANDAVAQGKLTDARRVILTHFGHLYASYPQYDHSPVLSGTLVRFSKTVTTKGGRHFEKGDVGLAYVNRDEGAWVAFSNRLGWLVQLNGWVQGGGQLVHLIAAE